ncbi:MAG TPA: hypothetical protein VIQ55_11295 [Burkholderiales bacterium]|jgi:hypothetical protein
MDTLVPIYRSPACTIEEGEHYLHCTVGPGQPRDIQECYRTLATECLLRKGKSVLVVGGGGGDSFVHLAGRDSLRAIALAGVPPGFRLAFVALSSDMIAIYDAAVVEAGRRGIQARRFRTEGEATAWLVSP